MVLGDLGAEVIKVERPGSGDDTRTWGPPYAPDTGAAVGGAADGGTADGPGTASYFLTVNRNKRSLVLDLGDPVDRDRARALALDTGIVVENFRPGTMDRLGLGYDALRAERRDLVYCSINAFGSGAGATLPGYDLMVQAVGGLMSVTGDPHGEPQKVGVAVVDVMAGLFTAVGLLAAVRHRDRTGEGQRVEVDLLSSLLAGLVNQAGAYTTAGVVPARMGNRHPSIAPYETLPTGDGELAVAVGNDRQFTALCQELGLAMLATDERFSSNAARVAHRNPLRQALVAVLATDSTASWAARLSAVGVPAGPVNDIAGAFALAESLGLEPTVQVGDYRLPRNPIRMTRTPASYRLPPPRLGERS